MQLCRHLTPPMTDCDQAQLARDAQRTNAPPLERHPTLRMTPECISSECNIELHVPSYHLETSSLTAHARGTLRHIGRQTRALRARISPQNAASRCMRAAFVLHAHGCLHTAYEHTTQRTAACVVQRRVLMRVAALHIAAQRFSDPVTPGLGPVFHQRRRSQDGMRAQAVRTSRRAAPRRQSSGNRKPYNAGRRRSAAHSRQYFDTRRAGRELTSPCQAGRRPLSASRPAPGCHVDMTLDITQLSPALGFVSPTEPTWTCRYAGGYEVRCGSGRCPMTPCVAPRCRATWCSGLHFKLGDLRRT